MFKAVPVLLLIIGLAVLACVPLPRPARQPLFLYTARAEPLLAERRYTEALAVLEEAALAHPESPQPLVRMGQVYLHQGRRLLAEDAFNRALARDLDHPGALAGLAETMLDSGRLSEAHRLWQQAAAQSDLRGVFTGLGRTHLALLDFEAARAAFQEQQARRFDPEAQWYLAALTVPEDAAAARDLLQTMGQDEELPPGLIRRRDYLLTALEPFDAGAPAGQAAKAVGIAMTQAQWWPLAVHALTAADAGSPSPDPEILAFLGHALAGAGRPALETLEKAHQADPTSTLPLYFQGIYLREQGALRAAEAVFRQAIELAPDNAALYAELAQNRARGADLAGAEIAYLAAIQTAPEDIQFKLLLAQFYADTGYRLEEAGLPAAQAVVESEADNAQAYHLLGWIQFQLGMPEQAEANLRQALELAPDQIGARYHLARLLEARDQPTLAMAEYRRIVDWDTTGVYRDLALKDLQRLAID